MYTKQICKYINKTWQRGDKGENKMEGDKQGKTKGKEAAWCQVLCEGHCDVSHLLMTPTSVKLFCLFFWGKSSD